MMAATNNCPIETSVKNAYITSMPDGGTKAPSVPPAATQPVDRPVAYPRRFISGRATLPIVAAVAMEDPVTAPNPAQPPIVASARPPRSPPKTE